MASVTGVENYVRMTPCVEDPMIGTTDGDDTVVITEAENGMYAVTINNQTQYVTAEQLAAMNFELGAGNDTFINDTDVDVKVDGGDGDDTIYGGDGNDEIDGGRGKDRIFGGNGNDTLKGGADQDYIYGGNGDDIITGVLGNENYLYGGNGDDTFVVFGNKTNNIDGGGGYDTVIGDGCQKPVDPKWNVTQPNNGWATVDTGAYLIQVSDDSQVKITNKATGETYWTHGDPHQDMNGDGKTDYDFWGTQTVVLDDGTKVTMQTEPWGKNNNATVVSSVIVSKGDQAAKFEGASMNQSGDLKVSYTATDGAKWDSAAYDGMVVEENENGAGFLGANGELMSQDYVSGYDAATPWNERAGSAVMDKAAMEYGAAKDALINQAIDIAGEDYGTGSSSKAKAKGGGSWWLALLGKLGEQLNSEATKLEGQLDGVAKGEDKPGDLLLASAQMQRLGFMMSQDGAIVSSFGSGVKGLADGAK